jgi:hypothetical protein
VETVIIGAVRVLGALPVLRWAFVGAIIAILVDTSDIFLMNLLDLGGLGSYQRFDKYADLAYLLTFLAVAWRWQGPARSVAVALFVYRMVGFVAFEATGQRAVLLFFPNLFEFWFLFVASLPHWNPAFAFTPRRVISTNAVLLVAKEAQEFVLHWGRWLDNFTAVEAVQAMSRWLTPPY